MTVTLSLPLPDDEADALAQLCKRFTHNDAERFANKHEPGESDRIMAAVDKLRTSLAERGFAPR